jgi:hypothetical protein
MDEIISYKMCAVKVRNAKLRNYLNGVFGYIGGYPANHRTCIYDVGYPLILWLYFDCARNELIVNRSETSSHIF